MFGVVFARLQVGVNEGSLGERLGQEQVANAGRFVRNHLPEFLVEHLIAEFADKCIWRCAGLFGFQLDFSSAVELCYEDIKKAAKFVGSLFYGIGPVDSWIETYNSSIVRQVIGHDATLGHFSKTGSVRGM
jgi:hypothetical protein